MSASPCAMVPSGSAAETVTDCTGDAARQAGQIASIIARITIGTPAMTKTLPI